MTRLMLTSASLLFALAVPAFANNCTDGIKAVQKVASATSLQAEVRNLAGTLIEDAVLAQQKGDGKSCNVTLAQVHALLGIVDN